MGLIHNVILLKCFSIQILYSHIEFYINKTLTNTNRFNTAVFKLRECDLFNSIVVIFFKKEFKSSGVFGLYNKGERL